jgi:acyl dehydratase
MPAARDAKRLLDWRNLQAGQELPGFELLLNNYTTVSQVSGSQDWNTVHHDPDYARESGHAGIFYNTGWTQGLLTRLVTDWVADQGWLLRFKFEMRKMNMNGDIVRARGKVVSVDVSADYDRLVELEIWLENDRAGVTTTARAVVAPVEAVLARQ